MHLLRLSCDFCPLFCLFVLLHLSLYVYWNILACCNETNLIMAYDLFSTLINSGCKYFVENFCIYVHEGNLSFMFCVCVPLSDSGFIEWVWWASSFFILWDILSIIGVVILSMSDWNWQWINILLLEYYYCFNVITYYKSV
jgi:hypothetical protein